MQTCVDQIALLYGPDLAGEQRNVDQGRQRADEAQVAACLASPEPDLANICALALDTLDVFEDDPCTDLYIGAVEDGGDCLFDEDCSVASSFCAQDTDPSVATCGGVCTPSAGGDGCFIQRGLRRDRTLRLTIPVCDESVCVPRVLAGEECFQKTDCVEGLACQGNVTTRSCQTPFAVGEECSSNDECSDELFCRFDDEGDSACAARLGEGESCDAFSSDCEEGLSCEVANENDPEGVCAAEKPEVFVLVMNQGEACGYFEGDLSNEVKLCRPGLFCLGFDPFVEEASSRHM